MSATGAEAGPSSPPARRRGLAAGTVRGTLWNIATFALSKGSILISTVVLARLLPPSDFGLLALGLMVILYLDVIGDLGVGAAVIYRQQPGSRDASTAVLVSALTAAPLAGLVVLAAPGLAALFDEPRLTDVVRVLAIAFFVGALGVVQKRTLERDLDFRRRLVPELAGALVKGGASVGLALAGAGVWSLVWGQVLGVTTTTVLYWLLSTWRFHWAWDRRTAVQLLRYGLPVSLLGLLAGANRTVDVAVIGRRLDAEQLGYYTIAFRLPELLVLYLCYLLSQALFPAYARARCDPEQLRAGFLSTLRLVALVTVPVSLGLAVVAADVVPLLFGDRWGPSVPVLRVLAVYALVYALAFNVGDVYKATGRPGVLNVFAVGRLAVAVPLLWLLAPSGVVAVAAGLVVVELLLAVVQLVVGSRLLQVRLGRMLAQYLPPLAGGAALVAVTVGLRAVMPDQMPAALRLAVLVAAGAVAYVGLLSVVSRGTVRQLRSLLLDAVSRRGTAPGPAS
jgi:lipopolysaccharide exporter